MEDVGRRTLQIPQATVHSSDVAEAWLAWHSIPAKSISKTVHIAMPKTTGIWLTEIHDVVAADGAVIHDNVPSPEGHRVPLC